MVMLLIVGACLGPVATAAASIAANLPAIDPGPRPLRLVQDLEEGPLKRRLLSCAQGPFQRTAFAIGHRGACLAYPEHTRESYLAAARQGAGIIECDVTFTKDLELVCRHAQNDLHTSTDILSIPDLAAKCRRPFTPATFAADGRLLTPASAECWTSDLTLAEFRRLRGRRDGFNPRARTAAEYQQPPDIAWSGLEAGAEHGTLLTHRESIALFQELGVMMIPELKESLVPLPYNGLSRAALAQRLIDDYRAAGVDPRHVWPQSFLREDIDPGAGIRSPGGLSGGRRAGRRPALPGRTAAVPRRGHPHRRPTPFRPAGRGRQRGHPPLALCPGCPGGGPSDHPLEPGALRQPRRDG